MTGCGVRNTTQKNKNERAVIYKANPSSDLFKLVLGVFGMGESFVFIITNEASSQNWSQFKKFSFLAGKRFGIFL